MIAMDLPKWVIKAIGKRCRGFIWKGQEEANDGNCFFSWNEFSKSSMATLVFLTLKLLAGHFATDGYGCRKLMLIALGLVYFSSSTKLSGLV